MAQIKIQFKVVKADGSLEQYLHTKVIGTISNALAQIGQPDICVAEHLAEVVTYYIYHKLCPRRISSSEILSIIKAVLTSTEYHDAAVALTDHHFERKLKRSRTEVVSLDVNCLEDADILIDQLASNSRDRWDKSRIVEHLVSRYNVPRQAARTVASMVEEKIFQLGLSVVPLSLIKQLVITDTAAVLRAHRQLQTV